MSFQRSISKAKGSKVGSRTPPTLVRSYFPAQPPRSAVIIPQTLTMVHKTVLRGSGESAFYIQLEITKPTDMPMSTFDHWYDEFVNGPLFTTMLKDPSEYLAMVHSSWVSPVVNGFQILDKMPPET